MKQLEKDSATKDVEEVLGDEQEMLGMARKPTQHRRHWLPQDQLNGSNRLQQDPMHIERNQASMNLDSLDTCPS